MLGIYIHIPFCIRKCNYCDFASYPSLLYRSDEYVDALCREISSLASDDVDTVYFGGGTPSLLEPHQLSKVMNSVRNHFNVLDDAEITIEVNPCTVNSQKANALYDIGFNRVSLGSQSFIDSELKTLGRVHTSSGTINSFERLRKAGFSNISLDLMYAIPGQTFESLSTSVSKVLNLSPEHISCYGLKIEESTLFYEMLKKGVIEEKTDDEYADMYELIRKMLNSSGYYQYELSNFSKKGFESKHNLKYWLCNEYAGVGLGASSFIKSVRSTHTPEFEGYVKTFKNIEFESLSEEEKMSEFMILSLRLTEIGANKKRFREMFGKDISDVFENPLEKHLSNGMIRELADRYILSDKAYYISNGILCDFV